MRIVRPGVRAGYERWAGTYDRTPNPIVAVDSLHTIALLGPRKGERILDAGCGTGRNLRRVLAAGAVAFGVDFAFAMLRVARRAAPGAHLVQADLQHRLPFGGRRFDAVLCSLIGEHLEHLEITARWFQDALALQGRLVFSVYHPDLAAAGKEANFTMDGVEYRLGAIRYTVSDYVNRFADAGFRDIEVREYQADASSVAAIPAAQGLIGRKVLLVLHARAGG